LSDPIFKTAFRASGLLLLLFVLSALTARPAEAQACSDYGGVLDGFAGDIAPSQLQIDQNCTIRNYPASNPLRTNFSFFTQPGQNDERWLIIFDNVVHTGQMSCNSVLEHKIWFTNGSSTTIQEGCQNLLIPVEKIDKANPAGQSIVTVGVPFTYTLTMPVLFDPGTGTVIKNDGSLNDLHSIILTDDLNATGVDLTFLGYNAYWKDSGTEVSLTFSNVGGVLTFEDFPIIETGDQIVIELTVVLDDSPVNVNGTQFSNTAKWSFGRLIEGVFYEPLPGEWGISPPLTISGPDLTVTKSGPAFMNLGLPGDFTIDVHNIGGSDAWNVTILDELPNVNGPVSGGMCDATPTVLSAQVFAADGVTPVPGKGPLSVGTDFSVTYTDAPFCELSVTMLSAAGTIGADERLIIVYQTELDADTDNGVTLTNVAGAVEWFNGDPSIVNRQSFVRTLTNGTPGILDHEDAHTVSAALSGSYFTKTVSNVTTGLSPATTATPGDTLRYSLTARTTDTPLVDATLVDDLGSLNGTAVFVPGSLALDLATLPGGANPGGTNPMGGTNSAGLLAISNLNLATNSEFTIEFEITLAAVIDNGTVVLNQSELTDIGGTIFLSDDPSVNGAASPDIDGDEDPTEITIVSAPLFDVDKVSADVTGDPSVLLAGDTLRYTITVKNIGTADAIDAVLRDSIPADTTYVAGSTTLNGVAVADPPPGVSPLISGISIYAPEDPTPGAMRADASATTSNVATIVFDVVVDPAAIDGTIISNQGFVSAPAGGVTDQPSDDPATPAVDDPTIDIIGVDYVLFEKTVSNVTTGASPATTASPGDTLRYSLRLRAADASIVGATLIDDLGALNASAVFAPGTLVLDSATVPAGADSSGTDPTGGTQSTGLLRIDNLDIAADSEITIEFEITLAASIDNGLLVLNQSELTRSDDEVFLSDDPNVNGPSNPLVSGDEDPTQIEIASAPLLEIDKVSSYLDGDPTRLMAGERLRYTITVANVGSADVTDAVLRDQIPVSTTYIAGSTTLNGTAVADPASGVSPLSQGLSINAPSDATPGSLPADASSAPANVATIVFDVLVDADVVDGTIVSNQAFVSAVDAGIADQPSDDPRTPVEDDPTRDVVGNMPLLYAEKSAALETDLGTPNVVDPGDVLRYTITVYNNGPTPASDVVISDAVPSNTTYVADSMTLNGIAIGADNGVSPLIAGLAVSSTDLTPPLPGAGEGTLTTGGQAVIQFDVLVDAAATPGTLIVNQATVTTYELAPVLTDGDGNPATGPEPTVVVVGPSQQLSISKQVAVVGGGPALAGATLEYTVRVLNIAPVPATLVRIYDDLDLPVAGQLAYVDGSATMNGLAAGIVFSGSLLTADYGNEYGLLEPGDTILLRFEAVLDTNLAMGTVVTNTAEVSWNDPPQTETASVSINVGGMPGVGILSGSVWHDADFDDVLDSGERTLENWTVELSRGGTVVHVTTTDADGNYRISGIAPAYMLGDRYDLRFTAPGAGANTAALGLAFSDFTNGLQEISDIAVESGSNLEHLDLPIDPNGVVYNATSRAGLAGAVVTLLDAGTGLALPSSCFDDPVQQGQVTPSDGYYKFDMNFSQGACPEGGDYLIQVTPPSAAFIDGESGIIPPQSGSATPPLSVPGCLQGGAADAIPLTTLFCEATTSELAPSTSVPARSAGTTYYLHLTLDNSRYPGSSQIFNNHIPLDPDLADSVTITKTSPVLTASRGQLVPYVITVTNDIGFQLSEVSIVDRLPPGFKYVEGSARIDRVPAEPDLVGGELVWSDLAISGAGRHELELLVAVGAGVSEGDFVNRAQVVHGVTGEAMSGEATATVRLVPDPDFDCTDVMGKVFNDVNLNGLQDSGESGIPGVRLVTATGLSATTDGYGRYHITCATVPHDGRGSNFVVKLDDRTLPSGFRASSPPVQIQRATRGKALRFNFSGSINRVIGLDISDPIFEPDLTELRPQWQPRIGLLLEQLVAAPAVLRLSYLADREDPQLVDDRLEAIEDAIRSQWDATNAYPLEIETEVFWRLGAPQDRPDGRRRNRR
jgi:uncharacterized repeat protein (TIGR01451 family)